MQKNLSVNRQLVIILIILLSIEMKKILLYYYQLLDILTFLRLLLMLQSFDKVLFNVGQWGFIYFLHYVFVTCTDKLELGERIEFKVLAEPMLGLSWCPLGGLDEAGGTGSECLLLCYTARHVVLYSPKDTNRLLLEKPIVWVSHLILIAGRVYVLK